MKTGVELIAEERAEQIQKHGYTEEYQNNHPGYYSDNQLATVARALISKNPLTVMENVIFADMAKHWDEAYLKYAASKNYKERLIIAGALIAAEIDRINQAGNTTGILVAPEKK